MINVLELFKGTGSFGKVIKELYPEANIISLDILEKYEPTHCCDILDFEYKQYQTGHFDIIWASPECKVFSQRQYSNIGRIYDSREHLERVRREHYKYVERTVEIIRYLEPDWWFIENPYYSAMREVPVMKELPSYRFDYCQFKYSYKKPTRIWTNRTDLIDISCTCASKHRQMQYNTSQDQRYSIPRDLLLHLLTNA